MRIAVAGGTGTVGRYVVDSLSASGHEPIILTRSTGVDLRTGDGLLTRLAGVDAVVDATSVRTTTADVSERFFRAVTSTLLAAEVKANVRHHLAISIVGAAELGTAYFAGKRVQEELVMAAEGRWTIVRATQFHEFIHQVMPPGALGPLQIVPTFVSQTVAASEVGAVVARLATESPAGLTEDVAGPSVERMADLVRRYLRATGSKRPVLEVPIPGAWGRSLRDGSLLPKGKAILGMQTFDEWLADGA
jgi:uncharacterized protein YbjT (DUF2867 family)